MVEEEDDRTTKLATEASNKATSCGVSVEQVLNQTGPIE